MHQRSNQNKDYLVGNVISKRSSEISSVSRDIVSAVGGLRREELWMSSLETGSYVCMQCVCVRIYVRQSVYMILQMNRREATFGY